MKTLTGIKRWNHLPDFFTLVLLSFTTRKEIEKRKKLNNEKFLNYRMGEFSWSLDTDSCSRNHEEKKKDKQLPEEGTLPNGLIMLCWAQTGFMAKRNCCCVPLFKGFRFLPLLNSLSCQFCANISISEQTVSNNSYGYQYLAVAGKDYWTPWLRLFLKRRERKTFIRKVFLLIFIFGDKYKPITVIPATAS